MHKIDEILGAFGKGLEPAAELERLAEAVRGAVTPLLLEGSVRAGTPQLPVTEALVLARHVTAAKLDDAALAHRVLVEELDRQLREVGIAEEHFVALVNLLQDLLYVSGRRYQGGEWPKR